MGNEEGWVSGFLVGNATLSALSVVTLVYRGTVK